jgi:hypothetical protein
VVAHNLQAVQAFPQGADAAGVMHNYRNTLLFGRIECIMPGLVRNLVGENDHGVGTFDFAPHILFCLAEDMQIHTPFPGCFLVLLSQAVHAAYQYDAHGLPLNKVDFIGWL